MRRIIATVASVLMIVTILLTSIDCVSFNRGFYTYEYRKGNQAQKIGMSDEGLNAATEALLDYLQEKRDDIIVETEVNGVMREVYDERETLHMIDVRNLYQNALKARNLMAIFSAALFVILFLLCRNDFIPLIYKGWRNALLLMVLFVAFIAIWCAVDFNAFWMQFHYLFFDNDLFLLDPNKSIMINMFPESFFFDIVILIIAVFTAVTAGISFLLSCLYRRNRAAA